jgi:large conductance mechanosensitive channel
MISEFKAFAMKGNVVDMAVGIIIGAAFGKIVSSMVSDLMMPVVGLATSGKSFSDQAVVLKDATAEGAEPVLLKYGAFLDTIVSFVIVAFCLFLLVKAMNAAKRKEPAPAPAPAAPPRQEVLLEEIRDLLRKRETTRA